MAFGLTELIALVGGVPGIFTVHSWWSNRKVIEVGTDLDGSTRFIFMHNRLNTTVKVLSWSLDWCIPGRRGKVFVPVAADGGRGWLLNPGEHCNAMVPDGASLQDRPGLDLVLEVRTLHKTERIGLRTHSKAVLPSWFKWLWIYGGVMTALIIFEFLTPHD